MAHIAELVGVTPAEVLGTCSLLRDVQAASRSGTYLRERLHQHLAAMLRRRRGAARTTPRRRSGIQAGQHHRRRPVHARGRRVHRRVHRGAVPQVNYRYCHRITHDEFDQLIDDLRAGRSTTTCRPHGTLGPRAPAHPGRPGRRRRAPEDSARAGLARQPATDPPQAARARDRHRRPQDHHRPLQLRRLATRSSALRGAPVATRRCARRSTDDARPGRRRGQGRPACSAAAAPASRPA